MNPIDVRNTFIDFYRERGHELLGSSNLIPPDPGDPVLLVTSGMHPLTRYLEGQPHSLGTRLVNQQRCLRTTDLNEVGDDSHLTLFEMQGSWSLGNYSHEQSLRWGFELLTEGFGVPVEQLGVTVFGGTDECPPDSQSERVWRDLGIPRSRISWLTDDNWWSNGPVGLCGPDSEMFVWTGPGVPTGEPGVHDGWREVWNHVSMVYRRLEDGRLLPLTKPNVDTGMGFERLLGVLDGVGSIWDTSHLRTWSEPVQQVWGLDGESLRLVTDHLRSSIVLIGDGLRPGNTGRGYVLRRLIRRSLRVLRRTDGSIDQLPDDFISHTLRWFGLGGGPDLVRQMLIDEERRYDSTLRRGRREVDRVMRGGSIGENEYRWLWDTHGLPREVVDELIPS